MRWEPAAGALDHFFDDELVPATQGVPGDLLRKIEPFPTDSHWSRTTRATCPAGSSSSTRSISSPRPQSARARMDAAARQLCAAQVPGDTQRNLQVDADYSEQTFKHVLVPLWIVAYNYGSRTFQVLVNGETGRIAGQHPYSWMKIALAILAALIVLDDHPLHPGQVAPSGPLRGSRFADSWSERAACAPRLRRPGPRYSGALTNPRPGRSLSSSTWPAWRCLRPRSVTRTPRRTTPYKSRPRHAPPRDCLSLGTPDRRSRMPGARIERVDRLPHVRCLRS